MGAVQVKGALEGGQGGTMGEIEIAQPDPQNRTENKCRQAAAAAFKSIAISAAANMRQA